MMVEGVATAFGMACCVAVFILPRHAIPAVAVLCYPLSSLVPLPAIVWLGLFAWIVRGGARRRLSVSAVLVFVSILALDLLASLGGNWELRHFLGFVGYFAFAVVVTTTRPLLYDDALVLRAYLVGYLMLVVVLVFSLNEIGALAELYHPTDRLGKTVEYRYPSGLVLNPNSLGIQSAIAALVSAIVWLRVRRPTALFVISVACWFGLLSGSRTFVVGIVIGIVLLFGAAVMEGKRLRARLVVLLGAASVMALALMRMMPDIPQTLLRRLTEVDDISGGRIDLNRLHLELATSDLRHFFLGAGMQNYKNVWGIESSTHNVIIETVVMWGVVGVALLVIWLADVYLVARHHILVSGARCRSEIAALSVGVAILVMLQFSHGLASWTNALLVIVAQGAHLYAGRDENFGDGMTSKEEMSHVVR